MHENPPMSIDPILFDLLFLGYTEFNYIRTYFNVRLSGVYFIHFEKKYVIF